MRSKLRLFIIALCCLLLAAVASMHSAQAQEKSYSFSGRAFADLYRGTENNRETFQQLSASLWLQGDARLSEPLSARAIYQGDFFEGQNSRLTGDRGGTHLRNRLREGYVEYFRKGWQLRAGKQIIPWGKSDGINPTDFLSAKESDFLNHDSEVTRVGGVSLLASFTPRQGNSPWNFTAVIQPVFPEATYLLPPTALPAGVTLIETQTPQGSVKNTEYAGKVAYTGEGWDGSLSYFYGFDHRAELIKISHAVLSPTDLRIRLSRAFHRIRAVGADASFSRGDWIYRAESAYSVTENHEGNNPLITPSHWSTVLGAERPLGSRFRVNGQLVSRYFPRYTDPRQARGPDAVSTLINQRIAAANALLQQYQQKWETAATLRVGYTAELTGFTAEVLFYRSLNQNDYYLRPLVSFALAESLRAYLGYDHYGGSQGRSLGSLQSYNAVFTELKYLF